MSKHLEPSTTIEKRARGRKRPLLMHPLVFIGIWGLLGVLFALQEWMNLRRWGYPIALTVEVRSWGVEFLIWGILSWSSWRTLGTFIQMADLRTAILRIVPLSFAVCAVKEMAFVLLFPDLPLNRPHMPYWARLQFHADAEIVNDMVVFWSSFLLIRGLGYYQRSRESEIAAAQLETELAHAQLSALQMQLNPHFLFNAMNSISSLMRTDVEAADEMLEQLSSLLRISLERGAVQLISVRDEIEFVEVYLSMQDRRYGDRVRRSLSVDPELHDALIPAMVLQPIIENAYVHGLSKVERDGDLSIEARKIGEQLVFNVTNSGIGLTDGDEQSGGHGVGIANLRSRLDLHYGENCLFEIAELDRSHVRVKIELPIQFPNTESFQGARYGVE